MNPPWRLLVRDGSQALLEGRFRECERLAAEAARSAPAEAAPGVLAAFACREQGRATEAEVLLRALLADHPDDDDIQALLAAVLADLGRDGEAGRQLDALLAQDGCDRSPAVAALAAEVAAALDLPDRAEAVHDRLAPHITAFVDCHGAVSRHLGLACHVLGRWVEAEEHFRAALDANQAAGAPVLVAHTRRHYSALLRARGDPGDWDQAVDLLDRAATVYRRLEVGRLADEAEAVLRRSQDPSPTEAVHVFSRTPSGWDVVFAGRLATVPHLPGLAHIAVVLAADRRPVHVLDLVDPGDDVAAEFRRRLTEVDEQLAGADPVAAALGRAEHDLVRAELGELAADAGAGAEDTARRLVALRVRTALDQLDDALPALGRHLRRSIRTGTLCLYDPERPERWKIRP